MPQPEISSSLILKVVCKMFHCVVIGGLYHPCSCGEIIQVIGGSALWVLINKSAIFILYQTWVLRVISQHLVKNINVGSNGTIDG